MNWKADDDFSIDRYNLELEIERNSRLLRYYGKKLSVLAGKQRDEKRKLEYLEGEIAEIIRSSPNKYNLKKDTDQIIFKLVKGEPEYIKQFEIWQRTKRLEDDYISAVNVLTQRKELLGMLVKLWLNDYYDRPLVFKEKDVAKKNKFKLKVSDIDTETEF